MGTLSGICVLEAFQWISNPKVHQSYWHSLLRWIHMKQYWILIDNEWEIRDKLEYGDDKYLKIDKKLKMKIVPGNWKWLQEIGAKDASIPMSNNSHKSKWVEHSRNKQVTYIVIANNVE